MARKARQRSSSGTYHILLKHNDLTLFKTEEDGDFFLSTLKHEKKRDFMEVYAYCIFEGYVHIILKEGLSGISNNVIRITSNYANYYNAKYGHSGKIFKGRFASEPLDELEIILDATRFVHRLPLKYDFTLDYDYSSYKHYFKKYNLLSSDDIIAIIGSNIDYKIYCDRETTKKFIMYKESKKEQSEDLQESSSNSK